MTNTLEEMQFELLPSEHATEGMKFGIGLSVSCDSEGFVPGSTDWAFQDTESSTRGTTNFGRDRLLGSTWLWQLHVNESDVKTARDTLALFATAWRALHIRNKPSEVIPLRYRLDDKVRRVYGRPRKLEAPPNNLILSGFIPVQVDFKAVDGFVYDDDDESVTLSLTEGAQGGFTFPFTFPVTTLTSGLQRATVLVGGDAPTYPVVRFNGPVANPSLGTDDWDLILDGLSLETGEWAEIDMRPWKLTAMHSDGSSVAGKMNRRSRMIDMALNPGSAEFVFRGASTTGAATCTVRWASAYNSI